MKDYITAKKNFVLHKQICLCNTKIFHLISKNHLERKVNEKTIKKFFEADRQNKEETQQTIQEHF